MRSRILVAMAALALMPAAAAFPQAFSEAFNDITTLPGSGWFLTNHSSPVGTTSWFQGNSAVFPAQAGAATAYIGANFNNTTGTNTISNWMLTPAATLVNGATLTFWTRTVPTPAFPDRLQVRMSTNGASTNVGTTSTDVGDFTTLLLEINPTMTTSGYPNAWTQFTVPIAGVPVPTLGRLAFRYFVPNGGPSGANSDYIGIDTVQFTPGSAIFVRGDFNGDNKTDILWRHATSGQNVLWFMNGSTLVSGTFTTPSALTDTRWKMVGTHDFNADLKSDILWRHDTSGENVVWFMNGSVLTSGTFTTPSALSDVNWKMAGTGDFNADGKPDIAWRHQVAGQIVVWFMNGTVLTSGTFTTPSTFNTAYDLVGVADFSSPSDGKPDFLWRNQTTGDNLVWFMNGTTMIGSQTTTSLPDAGWRASATGDYSVPADGFNDIVWRHSTSGQNVMWFMNGATLVSGSFTNPAVFADNDWKIVGPR
jgi:hypothetical protein